MAGGYMTDANKKVTVLRDRGRLMYNVLFLPISVWSTGMSVRYIGKVAPLLRIMAACPYSCPLGHPTWVK